MGRFRLHAFVIMPDHVHVLFEPGEKVSLEADAEAEASAYLQAKAKPKASAFALARRHGGLGFLVGFAFAFGGAFVPVLFAFGYG